MLKEFKELILRSELTTIVAGLVVALATFYLAEAVVVGLIAPLISTFVGTSNFASNAFTIGGSEFRYGTVLEAAIVFSLSVAVIYLLLAVSYRRDHGRKDGVVKTRPCPECTSSISAAAKRCPNCTAIVQPDLA